MEPLTLQFPDGLAEGPHDHRVAMRLARIDDLDALHEAAELSRVDVDRMPHDGEASWTSTPP